jgi:hypothetical protein
LGFISPIFAEETKVSTSFLEQLEALAEYEINDLLQQSMQNYYAADIALAQGDHPILLHDAAIMGLLNLLSYLVEHDPHGVDYAYKNGPTPLGYIAGDNQLAAAKILLKAGANPNNSGNMEEQFPLSSAIISGNVQMVRLLLAYKAKIHNGHYYQSPLGLILERNDLEMLQIVDHYNFQLDALDDELRKLVLEYLNSDFIEEDVLKILIKHGFDIYAKTPKIAAFIQQYAQQIKHDDVKKMLQDLYSSHEKSTIQNAVIADLEEKSLQQQPTLSVKTSENNSVDVNYSETAKKSINNSENDLSNDATPAEAAPDMDENTAITSKKNIPSISESTTLPPTITPSQL